MSPGRPRTPVWLLDAERVDHAVYAAFAATPTPALDRGMSALSHTADHSVLWLAAAGTLALAHCPPRGGVAGGRGPAGAPARRGGARRGSRGARL